MLHLGWWKKRFSSTSLLQIWSSFLFHVWSLAQLFNSSCNGKEMESWSGKWFLLFKMIYLCWIEAQDELPRIEDLKHLKWWSSCCNLELGRPGGWGWCWRKNCLSQSWHNCSWAGIGVEIERWNTGWKIAKRTCGVTWMVIKLGFLCSSELWGFIQLSATSSMIPFME